MTPGSRMKLAEANLTRRSIGVLLDRVPAVHTPQIVSTLRSHHFVEADAVLHLSIFTATVMTESALESP